MSSLYSRLAFVTAEDDQRLDALFTEPSDFYYNKAVITYSVDVTVTKRDDNVNRRDSISIKYCFECSEIFAQDGKFLIKFFYASSARIFLISVDITHEKCY